MAEAEPCVVLASASGARAALLSAAGLSAAVDPAALDEGAVKDSLGGRAGAAEVAATLAEMKALRVSAGRPGALVIGADQILDCGGRRFDKPRNLDDARATLRALRGRDHTLVTAAAVARGDRIVWRHVAEARLGMRNFSDDFLEHYLGRVGQDVCASVGAYRLEGMGAQLFNRIEGDYFSILGLPLLPLLEFLRGRGVLAA